jgi:hypothetical protein
MLSPSSKSPNGIYSCGGHALLVIGKLAIARIALDTPYPAGRPEQVGPDLTAFKRVDEDALGARLEASQGDKRTPPQLVHSGWG